MKRVIVATAILTGLGIIGFGVYKLISEQVNLLKSYCWKIKDVLINHVSTTNINITAILSLKNQSDIDITISGYNLDVYLDNVKVATVFNTTDNKWNAKSISDISFDINFNPKESFSDLGKIANLVLNIFAKPEQVILKVKGTATAKHSFVKISDLPIEYTSNLKAIKEESDSPYTCTI